MKRFLFGLLLGVLISMMIGIVPVPKQLASLPYSLIINSSTDVIDSPSENQSIAEAPSLREIDSSIQRMGIYGIHIGDSTSQMLAVLGEPVRKDPSAYGYTWWIYHQDYMHYVQVGILDNQIVSIYSNANSWDFNTIQVGVPIDSVTQTYPLEATVSFSYEDSDFNLKVADSYENKKYLVIDHDTAIEIYADIHSNHTVTAIRMSTLQTLLTTGGYSIEWTYKRVSPNFKPAPLSAAEQKRVDSGNERQLLDLVNCIRLRNQLPLLNQNEEVAIVARGHSLDMKNGAYFDHESPTYGSLSDRMSAASIPYRMIAENIAAGQTDAIEAHEGLMNSYGHRINILHPDFQSLGVGVVEKHYTQNFLR